MPVALTDFAQVFFPKLPVAVAEVRTCVDEPWGAPSVNARGEIALFNWVSVHGIWAMNIERFSAAGMLSKRTILFPEVKPGKRMSVGPAISLDDSHDEMVVFSRFVDDVTSEVNGYMLTHIDRRGELIMNEIMEGDFHPPSHHRANNVLAFLSRQHGPISLRTYDAKRRRLVVNRITDHGIADLFVAGEEIFTANPTVRSAREGFEHGIVVTKYNLRGGKTWQKGFWRPGDVALSGVEAAWVVSTKDEMAYVAGICLDGKMEPRTWLFALNSEGDMVWEKEIAGGARSSPFGLEPSRKGKVLAGVTQWDAVSDVAFEKKLSVFELGAEGIVAGKKTFGPPSPTVFSFQVDGRGNLYFFGSGWIDACGVRPKKERRMPDSSRWVFIRMMDGEAEEHD